MSVAAKRAPEATATEPVQDNVRARRIELVDDAGNVRIRLSTDNLEPGGPVIELLDEEGARRASVACIGDAPSIDFVRDGNVVASFGLGTSGPSLYMNGDAPFIRIERQGRRQVLIHADERGADVDVYGSEGPTTNPLVSLSAHRASGRLYIDAVRAVGSGEMDPEPCAQIIGDPECGGRIRLYDENVNLRWEEPESGEGFAARLLDRLVAATGEAIEAWEQELSPEELSSAYEQASGLVEHRLRIQSNGSD